jgi:hypothetical protein
VNVPLFPETVRWYVTPRRTLPGIAIATCDFAPPPSAVLVKGADSTATDITFMASFPASDARDRLIMV